MSESVSQHQGAAPKSLTCGVITVSDTRTVETDLGGALLVDLLTGAGHLVASREIVADDPSEMTKLIREQLALNVAAILMTGGTGISSRDQTFETVSGLFHKSLPGYGELFRMLSYEEIGAAAMLSRATAGLIGKTVLLTMPGSPAAVRLAMEKLVLPELPHLVREATKA